MMRDEVGMPEAAVEKSPLTMPRNVSPRMGIRTIKNENFATSSFLTPSKSPVAIVVPERDKPGITATACASPIMKDEPQPIFFL